MQYDFHHKTLSTQVSGKSFIPGFHSNVPHIMQKLHEDASSGHYAYEKMLDTAVRLCYWPDMSRDIITFCQTCLACQIRQSTVPSQQRPLTPIQPTCPFHIVADNHSALPTPKSGHCYMLMVMDLFSRLRVSAQIRAGSVNLNWLKPSVSFWGCINSGQQHTRPSVMEQFCAMKNKLAKLLFKKGSEWDENLN